MPDLTVSFEARNDKGEDPGHYDMFIDVTTSMSIRFVVPSGYQIPANGVKLYPLSENNGRFAKNQTKDGDVQSLRRGQYSSVFAGQLPSGFTFDAQTQTLTDADNTDARGAYEYLIWLQDPNDPSHNDFVDPGIRNR